MVTQMDDCKDAWTMSACWVDGWTGFPGGSAGREYAYDAGDPGFDPWVGKIPWRRARQPTPVFLPGESHGQRSLAGHSCGVTESDTTE